MGFSLLLNTYYQENPNEQNQSQSCLLKAKTVLAGLEDYTVWKKSKLNCFLRNRIGTTVICFPLGVVVNNQVLPCSSKQQTKFSLHVVISLQHPVVRSPAGIICKQVQYKQKNSSCCKVADFFGHQAVFLWWKMFLLF